MQFKFLGFPIAQSAQLGNLSEEKGQGLFSSLLSLLHLPAASASSTVSSQRREGNQGAKPSTGLLLSQSGVGANVGSCPKPGAFSCAVLLWDVGCSASVGPWTLPSFWFQPLSL